MRDHLFYCHVPDSAHVLRLLTGDGSGQGIWPGIRRSANKYGHQSWRNAKLAPHGKLCTPKQAPNSDDGIWSFISNIDGVRVNMCYSIRPVSVHFGLESGYSVTVLSSGWNGRGETQCYQMGHQIRSPRQRLVRSPILSAIWGFSGSGYCRPCSI